MKIYIIHPVRNITPEWKEGLTKFVEQLEAEGHEVYFPIRDTNQNETGYNICVQNRKAIEEADLIYIAWDTKSKGSLFDLGMAFALRKPIKIIPGYFPEPTKEKSFQSMVYE